MLRKFAIFLCVAQSILFLGHYFLYATLVFAWQPHAGAKPLFLVLALLSVSFLGVSLLGMRYFHILLRTVYKVAAVWLGTFNYLFMAACGWWLTYGALRLAHAQFSTRRPAVAWFGLALAVSAYGLANSSWTRVKRITVTLAGLPETWRGRTIALISDLHLGNFRNARFARKIVRKLSRENPAMVLIAGDLFDGTPLDADRAVAPLLELRAPLGTFFTEGNHEEFRSPASFINALQRAGVRVLENEKVELDGLQLLGVPYRHATHAQHLREVLAQLRVDAARASILICHAPDHPEVAAAAGIGLQVSGHTHLGQMFPYTRVARRMYGQFVYGLSRIGGLQVYTSSGAGTWGPPQRVGSQAEIVLIRLT